MCIVLKLPGQLSVFSKLAGRAHFLVGKTVVPLFFLTQGSRFFHILLGFSTVCPGSSRINWECRHGGCKVLGDVKRPNWSFRPPGCAWHGACSTLARFCSDLLALFLIKAACPPVFSRDRALACTRSRCSCMGGIMVSSSSTSMMPPYDG